ncbi:MAG TPA: hypothetical protein VM901_00125 [Bdellovibrionota bacterium]|jgi:hypothetical protein|nr:hypothetical protein [Bdellovibrionota bacterium]
MAAFILALPAARAQNLLTNGEQIYQALQKVGAVSRSRPGDLSNYSIAIIDNGFEGLARYGHVLGSNVKLVSGGETPESQNSKHGFGMAQIMMVASGAMQLPENQRPEVLLLTANGYTEFKKAVEFCIGKDPKRPRVDLILNSKNFYWGSDFQGGGFFNAVVASATAAGIVWVNAVGNTGDSVYFGTKIETLDRNVVKAPGPGNTILFESKFDDQDFDIVLSWNDFRDDSEYATRKDLDFNLLRVDQKSKRMTIVPGGKGNRRQIGRHLRKNESGVSGNAFEEVSLRLPERGLYAIRIYDRSGNFDERDQFQLRVATANPMALNMIHKNKVNEVTAPADRSDVIAVGSRDFISAVGRPGGINKPDVLIDLSERNFEFRYSDSFTTGLDTSSAAALYAGIAIQLMASDANFSSEKLLRFLHSNSGARRPWRWPLN